MTSLQDFYSYITDNYDKIRYEVCKNITYDPDIFDDVFNDSVIKVADAIVKRNKDIKDIRYYFFISCKQNYIQVQNKLRKSVARQTGTDDALNLEYDGGMYSEEMQEKVDELFRYLSDLLEQEFTPREVDIYLIYYRLKSSGKGVSYRKMAEIMDIPVKEVTKTIQRVKTFVRSSEEINDKRKELRI